MHPRPSRPLAFDGRVLLRASVRLNSVKVSVNGRGQRLVSEAREKPQWSGLSCVLVGSALATHSARTRRKRGRRARASDIPEDASNVGGDAFETLVESLLSQGARVSDAFGFTASDPSVGAEGVRGCVATRDIEAGELLLDIPLEACLLAPPTAEDVLRGKTADSLAAIGIRPRDVALSSAFAKEKNRGTASTWSPYLSMAGEPAGTFPCFYDEADLEALQSPPLAQALVERAAALESAASAYGLERAELFRAYQHIGSHRFTCEWGCFLMPLTDLMNHSHSPNCDWQSRPGGWQVRTLETVSRGEALTLCYSKEPNDILLLEFGFVLPGNVYDRLLARPADLRAALARAATPPRSEAFDNDRGAEFLRLLPDADLGESTMLLECMPGQGMFWEESWLQACGLAAAASSEETDWEQRPGGAAAFYKVLEQASRGLFETTLEEDVDLLSVGGLAWNRNLALQFRVEQKELLEEALDFVREEVLSAPTGNE